MEKISIVIPSYNESHNLKKGVLDEVGKYLESIEIPFEVIIVDDGNDRTVDIARSLNTKVISGQRKGLAQAVIDGINNSNGEYIIVMDADLQHPPELLPKVIESLKIHDLVVMTKHSKGASANLSLWRKLQSNLGCFAAKMLVPISDPMAGFFGIRRKCLNGIELEAIGFKIGLEIFCKANWTSHTEIPIEFKSRIYGESKGTAHSLHKHLWHLYKSSLHYKISLPEGSEEWNTFYEGNNWNKKWKQDIATKLKEISIKIAPNKTLDVGCGSSPNINYLTAEEKFGIDINQKALDFISKHSLATFTLTKKQEPKSKSSLILPV